MAIVLFISVEGQTSVGKYDLVSVWSIKFELWRIFWIMQTQLIPIELSAVGRVAKLGELYDARSDQFLHLSITKSNFPNTSISSTQNKETKLKYTLLNTFEEKFQTLDVSAEVKLSVMGGLFELEGSGRYFKDTKKSAKSAKASIIQSFLTTYDQVSITDSAVNPLVNDDVLAQIDATHVVVGIQWGGNVFISVEDLNQDNRDVQKVEGNLGVKIQLLAASLSGHGLVNVSDADKSELNKFSFEIYGDLLPDSVPQTLIEAVQFMKISPSLLQNANGGKGKAMKYTLLPLPALRKLWKINSQINALINRVDEATIKNCIRLFDEINSAGQKLNDVVNDVNQYQQYLISSKVKEVNDLKYNFEVYQAEVQKNLSEHLVLVRSGTEKVGQLQQVFIDASKSPYSWENMNTKDFTAISQEVSFLKLLLKMEISMLDKTKILQQFLWENFGKDIYILFFNYSPEIITDKTMNLFRKMIDNKNVFGPKAMFVAAKYDILQDQSTQKSNKINKISLYRNGTLILDNYQDGDKVVNQSDPNFWSFYQMQQHMMAFEQNLANVQKSVQAQGSDIAILKKHPVPIGFIYVQLAGQPEPLTLWPGTQWAHISPSYAGLFFRAEGGGSSAFGQVQDQQTKTIKVKNIWCGKNGFSPNTELDITDAYPVNSFWTGGTDGEAIGFYFRTNNIEIRPRNQAVRIWKRTG